MSVAADGGGATAGARPFVGRARQQAEVDAALEGLARGGGGLVFLTGEPGIGKTRLLDQIDARAAARGVRVAWGRCWEAGAAPAYFPFQTALGALWRALDDDERRELATADTAPAAQLVPALAAGAATPVGLGADPDQARFVLFGAVAEFLRRASRRAPVLLALDDLHDADRSSLALLAFLARDLRSMAVLIVGTFRDVEARLSPEVGAELARVGREGVTLALPRLDRDESAELARALAGGVDAAATEAVYRATQGNPLFIGEMLRASPSPAALSTAGELPHSVREVVRQRLRLLSDDARAVLEAAAALGDEFGVPQVAEALGRAPADVEAAVAAATAAGMMSPPAGRERRLRFAHALFREALYRELPASRRRDLHATILAALERRYEGDPRAPWAELTYHALEAGPERLGVAVAYAARASAAALDVAAYEDALGLLERVDAQVVEQSTDARVRAEALLALGAARVRAGDGKAGKEACRHATELARAAGDAPLFARAALGMGAEISVGVVDPTLVAALEEALRLLPADDSPLRVNVLARLAGALQPSVTPEHPVALAREAIAAARRLGDDETLLGALHAGMSAMMDYVDPAERLPLNREIEALASRLGDRAKELRAHARLFFDLIVIPDLPAAAHHVETYRRLADETRLPYHRWRAPLMKAMLTAVEGRVGETLALGDEAEALARASGDAQSWRAVVLHRYSIAAILGDVEGIRRWLPETVSAWAGATGGGELGAAMTGFTAALLDDVEGTRAALTRMPPTSLVWAGDLALIAWLSEILVVADAREHAAKIFALLAPHEELCLSGGMSGHFWMGFMGRSLGRLATCLERWDEAEGYFARDEARLVALGAPLYLARLREDWARLLLARGRASDRDRARALLDAAEEGARAVGAPTLVARFEAMRARLGGAKAPAPAPVVAPQTFALALRREGELWVVEGAGATARLKDSRGLQLLAALVASPDRELHALDLASSDGAAPELGGAGDAGDAGELLDDEARAAYRARIEELRETIAEAESFGDEGRRARASAELEALTAELARAVGLGGRARRAGSAAERARVAVQRRVKDALGRLEEAAPELGRQLARRIYTGTFCSYRPNEPRPNR